MVGLLSQVLLSPLQRASILKLAAHGLFGYLREKREQPKQKGVSLCCPQLLIYVGWTATVSSGYKLLLQTLPYSITRSALIHRNSESSFDFVALFLS